MDKQNKVQDVNTPMKSEKWRQILAAISINVASLSVGMAFGWSSPTIPQLLSDNPPVGTVPFTEDEISWLSSIISLITLLGLLYSAWSSERFGRKITGCSLALPLTVSWLLTLFAQNFYYLLIARGLAGLATGLVFTLVPVYVTEISSEAIRGQLGCYLGFAINIGVLLAFVLGAMLSYHLHALFALIISLVFISTFIFMPEAPIYLFRKKKIEACTRSLMWLRGNNEAIVKNELLHLQEQCSEMADSAKSVNLRDLWRDRGTIKGFIISLSLLTGQQTSGYGVVFGYTVTIFQLANSPLSASTGAIAIAVMQVIGSLLSTLIIERTGRRSLLLISCGGMMICHLLFGIFFLLQNENYDVSSWSWLPIASLSCYVLAYSMGLGPASYVVVGEVFSPDIASLGISISMIPVFIVSFLTLKLFPFVNSYFGSHTSFFILSFFCACTFVITYCLVPETKGRPRESIFNELNRKGK